MKYRSTIIALLFFALAFVGEAQAQYGSTYGNHLEVNFNGGVLLANQQLAGPSIEDFDEAGEFIGNQDGDYDSSAILGARAIYHFANGFGFGGQYAWSPIHGDDVELDLYSAELSYTFPVQALTVFAGAGVGGARVTFDEKDLFAGNEALEGTVVREDQTNWFVPLTLGFKYFVTNSLAFSAKARDNLIFDVDNPVQQAAELGLEDNSRVINNFQFSAGFSLML